MIRYDVELKTTDSLLELLKPISSDATPLILGTLFPSYKGVELEEGFVSVGGDSIRLGGVLDSDNPFEVQNLFQSLYSRFKTDVRVEWMTSKYGLGVAVNQVPLLEEYVDYRQVLDYTDEFSLLDLYEWLDTWGGYGDDCETCED